MNTKKYLVGACVGVAIVTGIASVVLADNAMMQGDQNNNGAMMPGNEDMAKKAMMGQHEGPDMVVQIGPNGRVTLRGTIKAVGSGSLTVTSWGGDWTVNVPTTANIMPVNDMTQFKAGDFVGVQGTVNQTAAWTIDATVVRDWTSKQTAQNTKNSIEQFMHQMMPKNWQGIISNMVASPESFTLTVDGTAYTVNVTADAKIVNKDYVVMSFADIKAGDTVRVWGPASGTVITASVLRDMGVGSGTSSSPHENQ